MVDNAIRRSAASHSLTQTGLAGTTLVMRTVDVLAHLTLVASAIVAARGAHMPGGGRMRTQASRRLLPLLLVPALAGCEAGGGPGEALSPPDLSAWRSAFTLVERIVMEETPSSVIIEPVVTDDDGGFLVAEPKESQVRVHGANGRLLRVLGRGGQGPGELLAPARARRLHDGRVVVSDLMQPRLTFYNQEGTSTSSFVPVMPLFDFAFLNGDEVLAGGFVDGAADQLLHVFSLTSNTVVRSFMDVPDHPVVRRLVTSLGFPSIALRDGAIAAVMALSDTLYFFDTAGRAQGQVHLPIPGWVLPVSPPDRDARPQERQQWIEQLIQPGAVFWADEDVAVAYAKQRHRDLTWGVMLLKRDGTVLANVYPAPRLLATRGDRFIFADPDAPVPGTWLVMRRTS